VRGRRFDVNVAPAQAWLRIVSRARAPDMGAMRHPLDRAIWSALTSRQASLCLQQSGARRYAPQYALFAALDDEAPESLAGLSALIAAHGPVAFAEIEPPPPVPATRIAQEAVLVQMICEDLAPGPAPDFRIEPLGEAEAPEMLALATLTRPGPFFARTHQLGDFIGVKHDGRLVAMAGERMKLDGFTEVSGVCTHPDARGRGYAAALSRRVAQRIVARGETPFLHAFADNAPAIRLYETLGFRIRLRPAMTVLAPV
jgi:predicted GNAT family acetyltransferase